MNFREELLIMIRKLRETDIDKIAEIWLDTNIKAHDFIPAQYWQDNFNMGKNMFSQAEIYIFEKGKAVQGFIGMEKTQERYSSIKEKALKFSLKIWIRTAEKKNM